VVVEATAAIGVGADGVVASATLVVDINKMVAIIVVVVDVSTLVGAVAVGGGRRPMRSMRGLSTGTGSGPHDSGHRTAMLEALIMKSGHGEEEIENTLQAPYLARQTIVFAEQGVCPRSAKVLFKL
jgi:hypothetical protein